MISRQLEYTERFLSNPNEKNGKSLNRSTIGLIYSWSTYCLDEKKGDIQTARKLRNITIPILSKSICIDRYGVKSLLLACKMLQMNNLRNSVVKVYKKKKKIFEILYSPRGELENMFLVKEEGFGIDKELSLYMEGLKEYIIDLFGENTEIRIERIVILLNGKEEKLFYDKNYGVVWNEEDCYNCLEDERNDIKETKECRKLLEKECYKKFRHSSYKTRKVHEKVPNKIGLTQFEKTEHTWTCGVCDLENSANVDKCIACESPKE